MHISKDYDDRRNEFLDAALRLFMERGYDDTPITAIIDTVGVSKGAFYHYFQGKEDLLDAIAARAADMAMAIVEPIVADSSLDALDAMNAVFASSTGFKSRERSMTLTFLRVLYDGGNLKLRKRIENRNTARVVPLLARVIERGIAAGTFDPVDPVDTATLILDIGSALVERIASEALAAADGSGLEVRRAALNRVLRSMRSYQDAAARMLGAKPGSIRFVETDIATMLMGEEGT